MEFRENSREFSGCVKIVMLILEMFDAIVSSDAFTKPNEEKAFCLLCGDCRDR